MTIEGTVQISTTPYGELFDFSIPGKNISHFYLHDKNGKWYELSRSVLQSYRIILKDTEEFPVQFTRETGDIASLEAGENIRTRVTDLIKGVPFGDDLQFHFDHMYHDDGTKIANRTLQEIGISTVNEQNQ